MSPDPGCSFGGRAASESDALTPGPYSEVRERRINVGGSSPRSVVRAFCSRTPELAEGNVTPQRPLHHPERFAEVLVHGVPAE